MEETVESRREKKRKRKRLEVGMEAVAEAADRIAPVVGYFPSGYNPENADEDPPGVRLFRNKRRSNRLELVVSPRDANVEFVGTSYSGEAAGAQLCSYALGVLDKDTRTLKIVPIAANKIFRLEPRVIKNLAADMEPSEGVAEEGLSEGRKMTDLTKLYGTKKNKGKDKVWRSLNQQRNDPLDREDLDIEVNDAGINNEVLQDAKRTAPRNIPPYDSSAIIQEKAYLLDEIILKAEWDHLWDILEIMQSGADFTMNTTFWQENDYPSFVFNRITTLREIQDEEEQKKIAGIFSYITHLLKFWKLAKASRKSMSLFHDSAAHSHKIPRTIYQKLLKMFVDPVSNALSTEKKELLVGYILVLTLFADRFRTDPSDIAKDLEMTAQALGPYYQQLGCRPSRDSNFQKSFMTLPVPLQFSELKRRRRKR